MNAFPGFLRLPCRTAVRLLSAHIVDRNGRVYAVMCSGMPRAVPSERDLQTRRFSAVRRRVPHTAKYLLSRAKIRFP